MGVDHVAGNDVGLDVGIDDEVVATVVDDTAAAPLVESLLLAGVGPSLRPGPAGVEVCVVRGEGPRARRALGLPDPEPAQPGSATPAADRIGSSTPVARLAPPTGGTTARRAAMAGAAAPVVAARGLLTGSSPLLRTVLLVLAALVIVPVVAFFVSFKLAGG